MNYEQLSLLEIVIELLKEKAEPTPIVELIETALKLKNIEDPSGAQATRIYMDITTSSDFVYFGEGKWDLKANQSLDVYDRDGSSFVSRDEDEKAEEEHEEVAASVEDYDLDEDEEEHEDEEDSDDEYDENYDEEDYPEDYSDDDDDDSYLDEDKYNEYMDDYEDMYDKN